MAPAIRYTLIITVFTLTIPCLGFNSFGQEVNLRTFNYAKADSIALNFPKGRYKTYQEVVEPLTAGLTTEQEKFRAIYRWIADNVSYSLSNKTDDPGKALTKRKAVCAGYSSLLKQMCGMVGIECNVIEGWGKNKPDDLGQFQKETNHAWNEVRLNNKWYQTDLTWASGEYDLKTRKFYKDFDSSYFLPTPDFFIMQHYPKDKRMQHLDTLVKKSTFVKSCIWYEHAYKYGFTVLSPRKGHLNQNLKKDFMVHVCIKKPISVKDTLHAFSLIISNNNSNTGVEISPDTIITTKSKVSGQLYVTLKWRFPENLKGENDVDVYYSREPVSAFKINFINKRK